MAFETKDSEGQVLTADTVEEVRFVRTRNLDDGGVKLSVMVTHEVNGHRVVKRVPRAKVTSGWPGTSKTLKAHLFAAIDNAE